MCQQNEKAAECKSRIEETNLASSLVLDIQVLSLSLFLSLSFPLSHKNLLFLEVVKSEIFKTYY
jgi:hypothetical protein